MKICWFFLWCHMPNCPYYLHINSSLICCMLHDLLVCKREHQVLPDRWIPELMRWLCVLLQPVLVTNYHNRWLWFSPSSLSQPTVGLMVTTKVTTSLNRQSRGSQGDWELSRYYLKKQNISIWFCHLKRLSLVASSRFWWSHLQHFSPL